MIKNEDFWVKIINKDGIISEDWHSKLSPFIRRDAEYTEYEDEYGDLVRVYDDRLDMDG